MNELNREACTSQEEAPGQSGIPAPLLLALFLVAATLPLLVAAWTTGSSGDLAREVAAASAILAATLLYLQFLSSGRFESVSGNIGIDRTMGFHRIVALSIVAFAIVHPLGYIGGALLEDPAAAFDRLQAMLASPLLRSGVIALGLLMLLVGLAFIRTRHFIRYEFWRMAHGPVALLVGGLTLHHATSVGTYAADYTLSGIWTVYALTALVAAFITYAVRPWRMWREKWKLEAAHIAADGVTELVLRGPERTNFDARGGQFIWLSIYPHSPPFHDHPFSIASSPGDLPRIRLFVRHAGDCTNTFHAVAPGTPVAIDGPHGSFILPRRTQVIVMVAGGVGIAPLLGMLEEAADHGDQRPFRLLYAARSPSAFSGKERLEELGKRLDLTLTYCADEVSRSQEVLHGPICEAYLKDLIIGRVPGDVSVMLCGPPAMMEMASDTFLSLGVPMANIHYERFDFGAGRGRIDRWRRNSALAVLAMLPLTGILFILR